MREVKFRGKSQATGDWVTGTYIDGYIIRGVIEANSDYISIENWEPVYPESVGQYTGLKDKNGTDIHEGDVLHINKHFNGVDIYGKVYWKGAGFAMITKRGSDTSQGYLEIVTPFTEIIGNIFENPEMID